MSEKDVRELRVVVSEIDGRVSELEKKLLDNAKQAQGVKVALPVDLPPAVPKTFAGSVAAGAKKRAAHD
jgi:hypothetical protein